MTKTNAERAREYRARIRARRPPKKAPKSRLERNRKWRERKKQLQFQGNSSQKILTPSQGNEADPTMQFIAIKLEPQVGPCEEPLCIIPDRLTKSDGMPLAIQNPYIKLEIVDEPEIDIVSKHHGLDNPIITRLTDEYPIRPTIVNTDPQLHQPVCLNCCPFHCHGNASDTRQSKITRDVQIQWPDLDSLLPEELLSSKPKTMETSVQTESEQPASVVIYNVSLCGPGAPVPLQVDAIPDNGSIPAKIELQKDTSLNMHQDNS